MSEKEKTEFDRGWAAGMIFAAAWIARDHGLPSIAEEMLDLAIQKEDLQYGDEYDIESSAKRRSSRLPSNDCPFPAPAVPGNAFKGSPMTQPDVKFVNNSVATKYDLDHIFSYHSPKGDQPAKYEAIRAAAKNFAKVVLENTPSGEDRASALREIRTAMMTANAAVALEGRLRATEKHSEDA